MVDVVQEQVERQHPLGEAFFEQFPFAVGDDARHQVEGKNALDTLVLAVYGESNSLVEEGSIRHPPPGVEILARQLAELFVKHLVMRAGNACRTGTVPNRRWRWSKAQMGDGRFNYQTNGIRRYFTFF
jgi:hypothetical protein